MPVVINMQPAVERPFLNGASLEQLVSTGSGFHVASGPRQMTRQVLTRVVDLFKKEFESSALDVNPTHVGRLFWIDSGNSFDAFHVARMAAERRLDPKRVLRAIQVARPFTAFQFQQMLEKVPKPLSLTLSRKEGRSPVAQTVELKPLVIISDLMGLFYDEEIQEKDMRRAFHNFIGSLRTLGDRALVLALCLDHSIPFQRRTLVSQVLEEMDYMELTPSRLVA